jgi:hypothetical protein
MNNKLDTFNDSEAKCKHRNKYYEILDWDSPIKDRGRERSIKSYTFKCNECSKQEMKAFGAKQKEGKLPGIPSIVDYFSRTNILDHYRADKITKAGFFYLNDNPTA